MIMKPPPPFPSNLTPVDSLFTAIKLVHFFFFHLSDTFNSPIQLKGAKL